jgi:hypothetical protein
MVLVCCASCHAVLGSWFAIWFANQIGNRHQLLTGCLAKASFMPGEWSRITNSVLRAVIVIVAGFSIWKFSDGLVLAWETLAAPTEARWFNVLSALGEGIFGPGLALAAIALSATNQRLLLATVLAILAAIIYVAPVAAFFIAIMIYGF